MNEVLEIVEKQNDITYEIPNVNFPAYEEYKDKAQTIANYIGSMEVDADNIKEIKQTLAKARKLTDRLNRVRIDMKKELLRNYTVFEGQVKEIINIVDRADSELRTKVFELEEAEREQKQAVIYDIWKRRVEQYPIIETTMPDAFERWLSPKHLNKTTTMKAVEKDMTEWIQKTYNDMQTALGLGKEYLVMYGWKGDLAEAIEAVKSQKEVSEAVDSLIDEDEVKETFIVYGKKDIELTTMLLNDHNINYIIF